MTADGPVLSGQVPDRRTFDRQCRDDGSATVWGAVFALLPVCLSVVVMAYGSAVATRHRAASAADAAALAAASRIALGMGDACATAGKVAEAQGSSLVTCTLRAEFADVEAESRPPLLLRPFGAARAPARGGPR